MLDGLLAFVAVSAVVICTPGQDTALTIRNTLARGRRGGVLTAAGVATGQTVWVAAASTRRCGERLQSEQHEVGGTCEPQRLEQRRGGEQQRGDACAGCERPGQLPTDDARGGG